MVQLVSGTPLRGIRRADVAHQRIIGVVTSGANKPLPCNCNTRSDAPAKQQRLVVIQACITPMYRRYGLGIIITITIAPHHAFVIKRIYVGDLSWHLHFLARLQPSKILHRARSGSQENRNRMTWDLTAACAWLIDRIRISATGLDRFVRRAWLLQPFHLRPPSAICEVV